MLLHTLTTYTVDNVRCQISGNGTAEVSNSTIPNTFTYVLFHLVADGTLTPLPPSRLQPQISPEHRIARHPSPFSSYSYTSLNTFGKGKGINPNCEISRRPRVFALKISNPTLRFRNTKWRSSIRSEFHQ